MVRDRIFVAVVAALSGLWIYAGVGLGVASGACTELCLDGGNKRDATPDISGGGTTGNPCFDKELFTDICNEPPEPCPPGPKPQYTFLDNLDGDNDGQIWTRGDHEPFVSCGTVTVSKTGYYKIFDIELSESCSKQKDETGWLTVENSCNRDGASIEANAGKRYLVLDSDNTNSCSGAGDCAAGQKCGGSGCCVPDKPTFMGTFLLVAGEDNKICLHNWCPVWRAAKDKGTDLGFVSAGCTGANSIHFRITQDSIACEEDTTLKPCTFGCQAGNCLPDPCETANCPKFCKDGVCVETNPCDGLGCKHGCKNGRCLQNKTVKRPDADGDGYPDISDCDDSDAQVNPGQREVCGNGKDDDCDGTVDEADCSSTPGPANGDGGGSAVKLPGDGDGCSCRLANGAPSATSLLTLVLLALLVLCRGRRRPPRRRR